MAPTYTTSTGKELPLVFVYDGKGYYRDIVEFHDDLSTAYTDAGGGNAVEGLDAALALKQAVDEYTVSDGEVWMSENFKPAVAWACSGREG